METIILTIIVCIAFYIIFLVMRKRKTNGKKNEIANGQINFANNTAFRKLSKLGGAPLSLTVHAETLTYDPSKYRFDGVARPEFNITYLDNDGTQSNRDIYVHWWDTRNGIHYLDCWCYLRDERRTFRSDRIISAKNLDTNRKIRDIVAFRLR
ncbi:MAG: WYL domain-containing protein [Pseudomonadota bacterium]